MISFAASQPNGIFLIAETGNRAYAGAADGGLTGSGSVFNGACAEGVTLTTPNMARPAPVAILPQPLGGGTQQAISAVGILSVDRKPPEVPGGSGVVVVVVGGGGGDGGWLVGWLVG